MIRRFVALLLLVWVLGFALFALGIARHASIAPTDAIVVLTGGPGRIERGLARLDAGLARRMLISGVDRSVRMHELALRYPRSRHAFACCIDLGREAVDTRSNAEEAARWLKRNRYRTIRLVTTDWHMARSLLELRHALREVTAEVEVSPDAVRTEPPLTVLVREYNKYLLRLAALLVGI